MRSITLQVVEGYDRGRVFQDLSAPVSIGREEDNDVQLNDERVSRFHLKIQEEGGRLILTDLDSTNGTWVNGHPAQMKVLRIGDQVSLGRSVLLVGSPEEIAAEFGVLPQVDPSDMSASQAEALAAEHFLKQPPELPTKLRPLQTAQVSDVLAFLHGNLSAVLGQARSEDPDSTDCPVTIDRQTWQRLLKLQADLGVYLRKIAEPQRHDRPSDSSMRMRP
jgi:predicted component of type VI protein secretion system